MIKPIDPTISMSGILDKLQKEKLYMIEAKAYFESYHYTLERIKSIIPEQMPFKEYLIDATKNVDYPRYMRHAKI
jgi:hypothetical protein